MNINLKPWPFCGGEAEYISKLSVVPIQDESGAYIDADDYYYECVRCKQCGATIELDEDEEDGSTFKKWERRGAWIPCKERLPETWEAVWVSTRMGQVDVCKLSHRGFWVDAAEEEWYSGIDFVKAWMPFWLPDPYEGE